jgi:hypothetical protein
VIHDMDPLDHQYPAFCFNLAGHVSRQAAVAGIDLARFQRAPERSGQSTAGGRHNIVQRRRVRL